MAYETEKIIKAYDNLTEFFKQNSVDHLACKSLAALEECAKRLDVAAAAGKASFKYRPTGKFVP